ncbi:MAG TPA: aminotransferase class V-fold PLP-dependent enzyme [Candidatus Dormibacteraeota bacterium]|nr:aminotransferase class V-fold PLP-dependent enzyme [Candidatus Dormibacteraeota bacterium]
MAGRHFLQIPGPTNIPDRVVRAMETGLINHRGEDMPPLLGELKAGLRRVFGTEAGEIVLSPGSGAGAMESSLVNTVGPGDRLVCFANGFFGQLYARLGRRLGADVEEVAIPWGEAVTGEAVYERLAADRARNVRAIAVVHNETSTGVTSDLAAVRAAIDAAGHPALLIVDTISGLASMDFRFDEWGIDVAVCGSQKGLMLPPGLAIACVNERAIAACRDVTTPRSFFDWRPVLEMAETGFLPTTPPTALLLGLRASLMMLEEEGLPEVYARHARLAAAVRAAVEAWDLAAVCVDPARASSSITAVHLPEGVDGESVLGLAKRHLELELGAAIGPLEGRAFRIGHLGSLNELELAAVVAGTELALAMAGCPVRLGAGPAAAQVALASRWLGVDATRRRGPSQR